MGRWSIVVFLLVLVSLVPISSSANSASSDDRRLLLKKGAKIVSKSEFYAVINRKRATPVRHAEQYACDGDTCWCTGGPDCVVMIESGDCAEKTFDCEDPAPINGTTLCLCEDGRGKL